MGQKEIEQREPEFLLFDRVKKLYQSFTGWTTNKAYAKKYNLKDAKNRATKLLEADNKTIDVIPVGKDE
jgi:hypothetical protein